MFGGRGTKKTEERRDATERREIPERPGSLTRGKLHCRHQTTVSQKLNQYFSIPLESSFQQGDEPYRPLAFD